MKNKFLIFILFFFSFSFSTKALEINSANAILYNMNNDEIIYQKNSDEIIKIASLTKIMTSIVAIENIDSLSDTIVITNKMLDGLLEQNASVAGLKVGDIVTYEDLLYATLLPSGADAAQSLAISISGNVKDFVDLMNEKANQLHLNNTYFTNTSGLDYLDNHSTVKDVAEMLKYALKNETFKKIFKSRYYTTTNGLVLISTTQTTSLKYNIDTSYIIGSKTGTTTKAGLCLASITNYNGINYLLVTAGADKNLNKPLNFIDSDKIYKYFFENYNNYSILKKGDVLLSLNNKYSKNKVDIISDVDYSIYLLKNQYENIRYEYVGKEDVSIFTKDVIVGKYNIVLNDEIIKTIDIYKPKKMNFSIFLFIFNYLYVFIPLCVLIVFCVVILKKIKNTSF